MRPANKRFKGHAETPFIIGFFSLVFGLIIAALKVAKHNEYPFHLKVRTFLIAPVMVFLFIMALIVVYVVFNLVGFWLSHEIRRRRSHKD